MIDKFLQSNSVLYLWQGTFFFSSQLILRLYYILNVALLVLKNHVKYLYMNKGLVYFLTPIFRDREWANLMESPKPEERRGGIRYSPQVWEALECPYTFGH